MRLSMAGAVTFINDDINYQINVFGSQFTSLKVINCVFSGSKTDGFFTTRWGTIATCDAIYVEKCITKSSSLLIRDVDANNIYVNGLIGDGVQVRIFMAGTATDTNIYVDGLIMPVANSDWNYIVEGITGKLIVRGMSAGINTNSVSGGVTKEVTTIPTA